MSRIILLLSLLILGSVPTSIAQMTTQKVDLVQGRPVKMTKRGTLKDIVGVDGTGFYALKYEGTKWMLERFDRSMNLIKSSPLDLTYEGKAMEMEELLYMNNKLFLFSSFNNVKQKKKYIFVQEIAVSTLKVTKKLRKLGEIDTQSRWKSGSYVIELSRDSTKIMLAFNSPMERDDKEKFGFNVLDTDLNSLWSSTIELPYSEGRFDTEDYLVDNNGNVFITGIEYFENTELPKRGGKPNYTYHVLRVDSETKGIKDYTIAHDEHFITDLQIAVRDNEIIGGGFYSTKGTVSIRGACFLQIDLLSSEIKNYTFKEFDNEFITMYWSDRETDKAIRRAEKRDDKLELYKYNLDDIIVRRDGGAVLIAEQNYVQVVTTTSYGINGAMTSNTTYHYYYNDIIVVNIDPDGQIAWASKVPKTQHSINDNGFYSSYMMHIRGSKLYFVYNDNSRNLFNVDPQDYRAFVPGQSSAVVMVEMDGTGKWKKEVLMNDDKEGLLTRPQVCEQISRDEFILYAQRRKNYHFSKSIFR